MFECRGCGVLLTDANWYPSFRATGSRLCKECNTRGNSAWRRANPSATREQTKRYYQRHREEMLAKKKLWDSLHRERISRRDQEKRRVLRRAVLEAYGGRCACCGEHRPEFMAIDHVNGDGADHRRELGSRSQAHLCRWLRDHGYPKDRFRLLCHNCNQARAFYGYCPHEWEASVV